MFDLPTLMADLRATRRNPTDEEAALIAREGSPVEVAEALVNSCCTNLVLLKRHNKDRRTRP